MPNPSANERRSNIVVNVAMFDLLSLMSTHRRLVLGALLLAAIVLGQSSSHAQTVIAIVNGDPITDLDIEQRTKLAGLASEKTSRIEVIQELIDEKIKLHL